MSVKKFLLFSIIFSLSFISFIIADEDDDVEETEPTEEVKEPLLKINTRIRSKNCHSRAAFGDVLKVHYTVRENDRAGKLFDSSKKKKNPFEFQLGVDDVSLELKHLGIWIRDNI